MQTLRIPLRLDSRKRLAVASTTPDVMRSQILDVLVTALGDRPFRPQYGAGVPELLFTNIDPVIYKAKAAEIKATLTSWLKVGSIVDVSLSQVQGQTGTLNVTVWFSIIPGGETFQVTKTFTGLATDESFVNE